MAEEKLVLEGVAKLWKSGRDSRSRGKESDEQCICCEGAHVFGSDIILPEYDPNRNPDRGWRSEIFEFVHHRKAWIEGRRVRITVEVLDDEEEANA